MWKAWPRCLPAAMSTALYHEKYWALKWKAMPMGTRKAVYVASTNIVMTLHASANLDMGLIVGHLQTRLQSRH